MAGDIDEPIVVVDEGATVYPDVEGSRIDGCRRRRGCGWPQTGLTAGDVLVAERVAKDRRRQQKRRR